MTADWQTELEQLLSDDAFAADVTFTFDDGTTLPGHSQLLRMYSKVLFAAVAAGSSSSSSSTDSCKSPQPLRISMPGTSRSDWLTAMAFAYPLKEQPKVTWDNLEVRAPCSASMLQLHSVSVASTAAAAASVELYGQGLGADHVAS
jgi:hypothetical protein